MNKDRVVLIQFQERMIKEIEEYVDSGFYSSKAEFVREAVRKLFIELRKDLFFSKVKNLKKLSKQEGAEVTTPFLTKKEKEEVFRKL